MRNRTWTKAALAVSVCLFVLWWALGAGATLAWFSDVEQERNRFDIGELKIAVSYKNDKMTDYEDLEASDEVFRADARYEPGYTQVVYLKLENLGDMDFQYKVSVTVDSANKVPGILGNEIYLPNYLQYGVVFAKSETELKSLVDQRLEAQEIAETYMLDTWSEPSNYIFAAGEDPHYAALIITMPESVGNAANYIGDTPPQVGLGITVYAHQKGTMN